jgi:hypothetical protein
VFVVLHRHAQHGAGSAVVHVFDDGVDRAAQGLLDAKGRLGEDEPAGGVPSNMGRGVGGGELLQAEDVGVGETLLVVLGGRSGAAICSRGHASDGQVDAAPIAQPREAGEGGGGGGAGFVPVEDMGARDPGRVGSVLDDPGAEASEGAVRALEGSDTAAPKAKHQTCDGSKLRRNGR